MQAHPDECSAMTIRHVKIFQPSKSSMQSGRARTKGWVLTYELETKRAPEPVMGWVASGDTLNQVTLSFPSAEAAVSYAVKQGWSYDLQQPHGRVLKGRTYLDNFLKPAVMATSKTSQ